MISLHTKLQRAVVLDIQNVTPTLTKIRTITVLYYLNFNLLYYIRFYVKRKSFMKIFYRLKLSQGFLLRHSQTTDT